MSIFNEHHLKLLSLLSDGLSHPIGQLAGALNTNSLAVHNYFHELNTFNIPILKNAEEYKLHLSSTLLKPQAIASHLQVKKILPHFSLHVLPVVDSTNTHLKDLPVTKVPTIVCAEMQTGGRGRFGRAWHSPFGENIYCSIRWPLNCPLNKLSGLGLVVSLAIIKTLDELIASPFIKVKWPNDILWKDKKLCGSLIETTISSEGLLQVIIGIGLNVNTDTTNYSLPDKLWCSLYEITGHYYDRNVIIALLVSNLHHYIHQFIAQGLSAFREEWRRIDYLFGKEITLTQSGNTLSGRVKGINEEGQLILEDENFKTHYLSAGDCTLRS